jgi:hypothetical protein
MISRYYLCSELPESVQHLDQVVDSFMLLHLDQLDWLSIVLFTMLSWIVCRFPYVQSNVGDEELNCMVKLNLKS